MCDCGVMLAERKSTLGRKGSGGLHGYSDKSSQVTVHVKGQRGTSLVFDMDPSSPFSPMADEVEVEGEVRGGGLWGSWFVYKKLLLQMQRNPIPVQVHITGFIR